MQLLAIPQERGLGTLILIDEVLMYARREGGDGPGLAGADPWTSSSISCRRSARWTGRPLVASLLASDPNKHDDLGDALQSELFDVFRRQKEEGVQPVAKEEVAVVLRRRLFEAG